jgi:hypothetical protein
MSSLTRVVFLMTLICANVAASEPFDFALIEDYPYRPRDNAGMPHLIEELRGDRSLQFVVHIGDIHSPEETECSEASFRVRRGVLLEAGAPLVLTPGDNDWADCKVGPLAQLEMMRRVFYPESGRADGPGGFVLRTQAGGWPNSLEVPRPEVCARPESLGSDRRRLRRRRGQRSGLRSCPGRRGGERHRRCPLAWR